MCRGIKNPPHLPDAQNSNTLSCCIWRHSLRALQSLLQWIFSLEADQEPTVQCCQPYYNWPLNYPFCTSLICVVCYPVVILIVALIKSLVLLMTMQFWSQLMPLGHTSDSMHPLSVACITSNATTSSAGLGNMVESMHSCVGRKACWAVTSGVSLVYVLHFTSLTHLLLLKLCPKTCWRNLP